MFHSMQEQTSLNLLNSEYLLNFVDYDALGRALETDGYTEVNGGVLRRP